MVAHCTLQQTAPSAQMILCDRIILNACEWDAKIFASHTFPLHRFTRLHGFMCSPFTHRQTKMSSELGRILSEMYRCLSRLWGFGFFFWLSRGYIVISLVWTVATLMLFLLRLPAQDAVWVVWVRSFSATITPSCVTHLIYNILGIKNDHYFFNIIDVFSIFEVSAVGYILLFIPITHNI